MAKGVHVFDVVKDKHIDEMWVRDVLGASADRYRRLRAGRYPFTREEANKISEAFKTTYGIQAHELFDWDADILPPGRRRRAKRAVAKEATAA